MFGNLRDYDDADLEEITVEDRQYRTHPDAKPSVIAGQAFGADYDEDSYNQVLAESIVDARTYFDDELPAVVQAEIAYCLDDMGADEVYAVGEAYDEDESSVAVSKLSTPEVLELADETMDDYGLDRESILYTAHPAHVQRVMDIGENLGWDGDPFITKEVDWPEHDDQPWVRGPLFWTPREIATRLHHKVYGHI